MTNGPFEPVAPVEQEQRWQAEVMSDLTLTIWSASSL
jgi:hypothetical protein